MLKNIVFFSTQVKVSIYFSGKKVCALITPENHARFYLRAPFFFSLKFIFVYIASRVLCNSLTTATHVWVYQLCFLIWARASVFFFLLEVFCVMSRSIYLTTIVVTRSRSIGAAYICTFELHQKNL